MNIGFKLKTGHNDLNARRQKFGIGSAIFLILFGVIFSGIGLFSILNLGISSSWTRISGQVISLSRSSNGNSIMYSPVVKYVVDGKEYQITSSVSSSFMPVVGKEQEVAYNSSLPSQAKVAENISRTWWLWLFPIVGVTALIMTPILFVKSLRRSNAITNLIETGHRLQGILIDIQATGAEVNKKPFYKIIVAATNRSGTVQNYASDLLTGVEALFMVDFRITPIAIDVYADRTDPQKYYVDISDIPNLTPEGINKLIQRALKTTQPVLNT